MPTWNSLLEKTKDLEEWQGGSGGEILWFKQKPPIICKVYVAVPPNSLEPQRIRLGKVLSMSEVEFEGYFLKEEPLTFLEAKLFTDDWVRLWAPDEVWISLVDAPHPHMEQPTVLDFSPELHTQFHKRAISKTNLAPLWGQDISYFDEIALEYNSGPRLNNDPKIKYQQTWVEENMMCPFCYHSAWALTYACVLKGIKADRYDPNREFYILCCPKCERAVEAIPRNLIDG